MRRPGSRPVAFALLALGALGGLVTATQPWWLLQHRTGTATISGVDASAGLPQALAAVLGAGALLALTLRVVGRRILGVVLIAVGVAMLALAVVAPPPSPELVTATLQRSTLDVDATVVRGPWPIGFAVAAVAGTVGALLLVLRAGHWRSRADRFARPGAGVGSTTEASGAASGTSSTVGTAEPADATDTTDTTNPPAAGNADPAGPDADADPAAVWRALDAGQDPTAAESSEPGPSSTITDRPDFPGRTG